MTKPSSLLRVFPLVAAVAAAPGCFDFDFDHNGPHHDHDVIGSGRVITEPRSVSGFDAISLSGVGRLYVTQTGSESLEITAEDNVLRELRSDVVGGRLILGPEPGTSISNVRDIEYRLTVARLHEIEVTGACDVFLEGLDTPRLRILASGSSRITADGSAERQDLRFSGTSIYRAEDLDSRDVDVEVSGASFLQVRASDRLEGSLSGSSILEYFGRPTVRVSTSGASVIRHGGD
jgi:hypothetical protein